MYRVKEGKLRVNMETMSNTDAQLFGAFLSSALDITALHLAKEVKSRGREGANGRDDAVAAEGAIK